MNKTFIIRVLGLLGAVATSAATALAGDYVTAVGIVSAAFGSATVIGGTK